MGPRAGGYAVGKVLGSGIGNRIWIGIGIDGGILAGGRAGRKGSGEQADATVRSRGHDALGRARCVPFIAAPQPNLLSGGLTATPADKPGPMPGH